MIFAIKYCLLIYDFAFFEDELGDGLIIMISNLSHPFIPSVLDPEAFSIHHRMGGQLLESNF